MGILSGQRVIDMGHYISSPLCAMLLADQGAEVIRFEHPSGSLYDTPANKTWNRGKKIMTVDLSTPNGIQTARSLIEKSDVLVENFKNGALESFGLSIEKIREINPTLIHCSLPGFPSGDPRQGKRAWEGIIAAASGMYTDINMAQYLLAKQPVYTALSLGSIYGAILGAVNIAASLYAREIDGRGEFIEVSLHKALMTSMGILGLHVHDLPQRYRKIKISDDMVSFISWNLSLMSKTPAKGLSQKICRTLSEIAISPFMQAYLCQDKKYIFLMCVEHETMAANVLKALGIYDSFGKCLVEKNPYDYDVTNNLRDTLGISPRLNVRLRKSMAKVFLTRPAEYWEAVLNKRGCACSVIRSSREWLHTEHASKSDLVVRQSEKDSIAIQPGLQVAFSKAPGKPGSIADVSLPQSHDIVKSLTHNPGGYNKTDVLQNRPFDGIVVLDCANVLAGPVSARTLAELGARVIKIDSPNPRFSPRITCYGALDVNRGKQSILLDLESKEGLDVFYSMVEKADVVITNFRLGVSERLGIGYKQLKKIKNDIIFCNLNAYGHSGPKCGWPGFDPVAQAGTGIMERYGGKSRPELHSLASCVDYIAGYSAAMGMALALLYRRKTGEGQEVYTNLFQAAQLSQINFMYDSLGKQCQEPKEQNVSGESYLQRIYRVKNGHVFLGAKDSDYQQIACACELGLESDFQKREELLEEFFATKRLEELNNPAHELYPFVHPVLDLESIREKDLAGKRGCFITREHRALGKVDTIGIYQTLMNRRVRNGNPAPKPGQDTIDLLKEFGHENRINLLMKKGVVSTGYSDRFLP